MSDVLIIGKPNSGKSLLFNRLTGLQQKVANFPGITVEVRTGRCGELEISDFPGIYSLHPLSDDEKVAVKKLTEALETKGHRQVLCVLDATRLERSLVLGLQVLQLAKRLGQPVIFALNMMDEILSTRTQINVEGLQTELGVPVIPISARTKWGLDNLKTCLNKSNVKALPQTSWSDQQLLKQAKELSHKYGPKTDLIVKSQNQYDRFILSNFTGGLIFALTMIILFQSIFTWAKPAMDFLQFLIDTVGQVVGGWLPKGLMRSFVQDAFFNGIGSFLVFIPQIFILNLVIGILEDSGYMARAAIICHRPLSFFGLNGRSFVPLLSGHACAIPAILSARMIESPKRRILTMLTIPLTVCSARLPVYGLLVSIFVPAHTILGGLLGLQGLVFFSLYFFGIFMVLIVSAILSRTTHKSINDSPFVVELPPYRLPHWQPLLIRALNSSKRFVTKAGGTIFAVAVVIWALGYFPNGANHLQESYLGQLGHIIEPVFAPLGLDWRYGVAILMSFLAREVFVGTLGTMFGLESVDDNLGSLAEHVQSSGLTLASGLALIALYAIALQCVSTVAVLRKELGEWQAPVLLFVGYGLLAYLVAWIVFFTTNALV